MGLLKIRDYTEQRCFTGSLDGTEREGSKISPWFKYKIMSSKDFRLPQSELESPMELVVDCSGRTNSSLGKKTLSCILECFSGSSLTGNGID